MKMKHLTDEEQLMMGCKEQRGYYDFMIFVVIKSINPGLFELDGQQQMVTD